MKVSVITVCYQAREALKDTIESVLDQTYPDIEYVIVDGGSTDGTLELIQGKTAENIIWISEPDRGIYDAMNKGVRLCHGEYVIFMNAGDRFASSEVMTKMAQAIEQEDPDILYGDYYDLCQGESKYISYQGVKINSWYFLMSKMICHQAIIAKRQWMSENPFDIQYRYAADRKWLIQCVKKKAILAHVSEAVVVYDRTGISSASKNFEKVREEIDRCLLEEYPVKARLLQGVKSNRAVREYIRRKIFQK